jgi:predicted DNA-binding transcriptional regulator AlpA
MAPKLKSDLLAGPGTTSPAADKVGTRARYRDHGARGPPLHVILSHGDLKARGIRFSRQWIAKLVAAGKFPRPIQMGAATVGFIEAEVDEWIADRIRERDQAGAA